MAIDFPAAPTNGQMFSAPNGITYTYNGTLWQTSVGGGSVAVSDTPPTYPVPNGLWWNSNNGRLYVYYDDGTTAQWVEASPDVNSTSFPQPMGRRDVVPALTDYSWVNQGTATATQRSYGISFVAPSVGATYVIRGLVRSPPSTPYRFAARVKLLLPGKGTLLAGLCWRNSSSGSLHNFWCGFSASPILTIERWTNPTTFSSTDLNLGWPDFAEWMSLYDDGTTRYFQVSSDGDSWITLFSTARTTFITPDQVGFVLFPYDSATPNIGCAMTIFSAEFQ